MIRFAEKERLGASKLNAALDEAKGEPEVLGGAASSHVVDPWRVDMPFDVQLNLRKNGTHNTVTLIEGDAVHHSGADGTTYITPASMDVDVSRTGTRYVWLDVDMSDADPGNWTATLEEGASKPSTRASVWNC